MKVTGSQESPLSGVVQDKESVYEPKESAWLWTYVETFKESFDFANSKHFFIAPLLVLVWHQINNISSPL